MHDTDSRRSFLLTLGSLAASSAMVQGQSAPQSTPKRGYVLGAEEGEHLIHFRDHGNIFIKASAGTGWENFALGTQQITLGAGVPAHRHLHMDEAFYVVEGRGTAMLNDVDHAFEKGATIFIPANSWHAFANPDHEVNLLWIVMPAGLDGFFRETCSPPGAPPKQLSRQQIRDIALKYGTEFR